MSKNEFPSVPIGLSLIPYDAKIGDLPVELYGTFCRWSKEFEVEAVALNIKDKVVDITSIISQRLINDFNRELRENNIGVIYINDYKEELNEFQKS